MHIQYIYIDSIYKIHNTIYICTYDDKIYGHHAFS